MLKAALFCTLICSAGLAGFASGQSFLSTSGKFDSKHFSTARKNQASLSLDSSKSTASLKITENACLDSGKCHDLQTTRLNQTFQIVQTSTDSCNVKIWKGQLKPATRAVSRLSHNQLMMSEIEIRDARLSSCGSLAHNASIQILLNTRTKSSVGTSSIQFQSASSEMAQASNSKLRADQSSRL